ncbi:hypothetical protein [Streptomyces sp. N35]|uniref:hypothetical protein n=1 Tax=Streptomyces sp. N35 TaxID=2795730 RepID=UPI0018F71D14|nr:hypothetical protein [Streptomyces sp. N35]
MVPIRRRLFARRRSTARTAADFTGRVHSELALDALPDEDLGEDLDDALDLYEMGTMPGCEEAEYLSLVEEARDRIAEGE